ncbi:hypothetical protein KUF54_11360 [Comamonas sp. Y33R10-2]|uniref:hypothetical protein n=1 Tax=Comamonas sp. Y33R10-2 TaxID=2853257 RepID=UPI001C5CA416|nr:hypothetical protein [Comamonas sp. Y33R10-2]QXZ08664.1 hypothetical protein KUF54_11360 [Comamonas sp. Y33R10-2]
MADLSMWVADSGAGSCQGDILLKALLQSMQKTLAVLPKFKEDHLNRAFFLLPGLT